MSVCGGVQSGCSDFRRYDAAGPGGNADIRPVSAQQRDGLLREQAAVDRWVVKANIELFRAVLATEADVTKRAIITSLLAAEAEKTNAPTTKDGLAPRILASQSRRHGYDLGQSSV